MAKMCRLALGACHQIVLMMMMALALPAALSVHGRKDTHLFTLCQLGEKVHEWNRRGVARSLEAWLRHHCVQSWALSVVEKCFQY